MLRSSRLSAFCVLAATAATACSSFGRGDVQREWTNTFRELGILPIYPPREDVQVGDVFVRHGDPKYTQKAMESGFVPLSLYVCAAGEAGQLASTRYQARSGFPTTPPEWGNLAKVPSASGVPQVAANAPAPGQPAGSGAGRATTPASTAVEASVHRGTSIAGDVFIAGDVLRLRQVAFPEFSTISVTEGNLAAVVPVKALSLAFGASRSSIAEVQLKVTNSESYSVPAVPLLATLLDRKGVAEGALPAVGKLDLGKIPKYVLLALRDEQRAWAEAAPGLSDEVRDKLVADPLVHLDLVNEVFYARAFDVSVTRAVDEGARLDVQSIDAALAKAAGAASAPAAGAEGEPQGPAAGRRTPFERAERLNEQLAGTRDQQVGAIGGSLSFTSISEAHVGLRQVYERPIAIGYRAMTIAVNPETGEIAKAGASSGAGTTADEGPDTVARGKVKSAMLVVLADEITDAIFVAGEPRILVTLKDATTVSTVQEQFAARKQQIADQAVREGADKEAVRRLFSDVTWSLEARGR